MNSKKLLSTLILSWMMVCGVFAIEVTKTTVEMRETPLALDITTPRFGWQMAGDNGCMQSAYEIEVYTYKAGVPVVTMKKGKEKVVSTKDIVWNSGKRTCGESQHVAYDGEKLKPLTRYFWRVRVWDENGVASEWSKEAEFRLAPCNKWMDAEWIGAITKADAKLPEGRKHQASTFNKSEYKEQWMKVDSMASKSIALRKEFSAEKTIADATVYVCGLGHYELSINGTKVGDGEFTPLISDYDKTVYYNTYDVTSLVRKGDNALGVILGNGFYNVVHTGKRYRKLQIGFGPETLNLKMLIRYSDGTEAVVKSDSTWKYSLSPITFNTIYGGEDYDARLEQKGWNLPAFDDSQWNPVVVQESPKGALTPQQTTPVKIMQRYGIKSTYKLSAEEVKKAEKIIKRPVDPTAIVFDMGQNLSGFPEITVKGKAGQKVTILVSEAQDEASKAINQRHTGRQHFYTYTLKGGKAETWHPRFSYYGFRYIMVEGAVVKGQKNPDKLPVIENLQSCFVHNSAEDAGEFECSSPIFTAAHTLIDKAMRSNMQAVFTDCPHREKLGWLEQVHLNGPGLLYNYDLTSYYPKVMRDMADAQRTDGMIPTTAPLYTIFEGPGMDVFADSPEWGSAFVIVPFMYLEEYGDESLIREYYPKMRAYVDYLTSRSEDNLIDFGLGDWYDYGDFRSGFSRNTPVGLVASAQYYMDLCYIVKAAEMVGNKYDASRYNRLKADVLRAFNEKYFNAKTSQYGTASQCSNALPLFLDMVPEGKKQAVMDNLIADIKAHGTRLTTGDVGNRYLFQTLARNGQNELMCAMHNHEDVPGYGFQLKYGATTLTEQWDPRQGSSWNHFMMGQINEWFFYSLAGIQPNTKGESYQHMTIRPEMVGDLTHVKASHKTLWGDVNVEWTRQDGTFTLNVNIPANCSADVWLPGESAPKTVKSGNHTFTKKLN